MNILVVGGAGYIGSHMVKKLTLEGNSVVTLDNLSTGFRDAVKYGEFIRGDIADSELLSEIFSSRKFDSVMHFASYIEVGESVTDPSKYYNNNFSNTLSLLDAMVAHGVNNFIFSSTAAIFGEPEYSPIDEKHVRAPVNPYGESKLMVENALHAYQKAYGLQSVCLRYFNAAGADPDLEVGECHDPESHLIPLVLQAASGRRDSIAVFGQNYNTPDGSCVRDYIHVDDLCTAHVGALDFLLSESRSRQFNLGNGNGFSVLEVIDAASRVTGRNINVIDADKRKGDPAILVADSALAKQELNWKPHYDSLETIIEHAWRWELKHWS